MIVEDAAWALEELARRRPTYRTAWDYYEGRHPLAFATERFRNAFGTLFEAFAENLCRKVVNTMVDRVEIVGWADPGGQRQQAADSLWTSGMGMARFAGDVHLEAAVAGDGYLIVWPAPDGSGPVLYPQRAEHMAVRYSSAVPGRIDMAAKAWLETARDDAGRKVQRTRLTLYYADRIERYATRGSRGAGIAVTPRSFEPYAAEDGGPVVRHEWGVVPVFHFPNDAGVGKPGRSELMDVAPLQDALNKTGLDALVGSEYHGLPQRWATGIELPVDPVTGKPIPPKPGADHLWVYADPNAKFGQLEGVDLEQLLAMANSYRRSIALLSDTPVHRLLVESSEWPSGRALRASEGPLVAKVRDRTDAWGPTWGAAMGLAMRMGAELLDRPLVPLWRDAHAADVDGDLERAEAKARLGVPQQVLWRELGYTEEEVAAMVDMAEEERQRSVDRGAVL